MSELSERAELEADRDLYKRALRLVLSAGFELHRHKLIYDDEEYMRRTEERCEYWLNQAREEAASGQDS